MKVSVLNEIAIQSGFHGLRLILVSFQAQHHAVFLREEQVEHAFFILRSHDNFDEKLVDVFSGSQVDGTIADQHATESRDRVASQSSEVSLFHGFAASDATRVVVLEDGKGGLVELTDEVQPCIQVEQVVVR